MAIGAAIQAGILAGEISDILLLDVTPLSLGVETIGRVMTKVIARNTTVPVKKSEFFSTAADNQQSVEINVLQGERELVDGNKSLGTFNLGGIPEAPKGTPQIEVTFDINVDGILSVTATEKQSGQQQNITITGASNLSEAEIKKLLEEAEKNAESDRKITKVDVLLDKFKLHFTDLKNKFAKLSSPIYNGFTEEELKEWDSLGDEIYESIRLDTPDNPDWEYINTYMERLVLLNKLVGNATES